MAMILRFVSTSYFTPSIATSASYFNSSINTSMSTFISNPNQQCLQHHTCLKRMQPPNRCISIVKGSIQTVFTDERKGIVCYQLESGEVICEGFDEGPYYPSQPSFDHFQIRLSKISTRWKSRCDGMVTLVRRYNDDHNANMSNSFGASCLEGLDEG